MFSIPDSVFGPVLDEKILRIARITPPPQSRNITKVSTRNSFEHIKLVLIFNRPIGLLVVFANGSGVRGSILSRVIPKTQKVVLNTSLHNTQHYEVRVKGNVAQSKEWSSALPYTSV